MLKKHGARSVKVPAHTGGVDLRKYFHLVQSCHPSPRPHGRGGFKVRRTSVLRLLLSPRPHGRGGFKDIYTRVFIRKRRSPPTRAGWI